MYYIAAAVGVEPTPALLTKPLSVRLAARPSVLRQKFIDTYKNTDGKFAIDGLRKINLHKLISFSSPLLGLGVFANCPLS